MAPAEKPVHGATSFCISCLLTVPQDGESVLRAAASPPAFYAAGLLKPYVLYDVSCESYDTCHT